MPLPYRHVNFFFDFFEKRKISNYYNRCPDEYFKLLDQDAQRQEDSRFLVIVNCIPPYLGITKDHLRKGYNCFQRSYRLGFAMDLSQSETPREFLRNQLGKKVFKNLRQDRQRLERDHNITFKIYHGLVERDTYENLMVTLKRFIEYRFKGRISEHTALNRWGEYNNSVFKQINEGNASFFVFYSNKKPVAISLNYHNRNILYPAMISFDPDFYRYSPGRQMFYRQVEWCLENNYRLIDMGWGSYDYKIKFSNAVYKYHTQVIYPKNNIGLKILGLIISNSLVAKYYLGLIRQGKFKSPRKKYGDRWLTDSLKK